MELSTGDQKKYEMAVGMIGGGDRQGGVLLSELYSKYPDNFDVLLSLGGALNSVQDFKNAIPVLVKAVNINRNNADVFYSLGLAFAGSGDEEKGLTFINQTAAFDNIPPRLEEEILLTRACILINLIRKTPGGSKEDAIKNCLLCKRAGYTLPPLISSFMHAHGLS